MRQGEGHAGPKTSQNRKNRNQKMVHKSRSKIVAFPISADISVDIRGCLFRGRDTNAHTYDTHGDMHSLILLI